MLDRYYKKELSQLRELAAEFASAHPALAAMLGGPSADPDVERLLEGVAFQTALMRRKLDDAFPEFIHELARLVCPHYLRPIPATTVVAFSPKGSLCRGLVIPAGAELASVPVEGTRCLFRTTSPVEIHPVTITDAAFLQPPGEPPCIKLSLESSSLPLQDWTPGTLRLFLADEYAAAADLYLLLRHHLRKIVITPEAGGSPLSLPPDHLRPAGFDADEAVIPYPPQAFAGYRLLQEFFIIPNRFLFLDLIGWESWTERGSGSRFTISFELAPLPMPAPRVKRGSFILFATPAVNLFFHDAKPVLVDHRSERYLVRPEGLPPDRGQVFSIDEVTGFTRATGRQRDFLPLELFQHGSAAEPVYHTAVVESPVDGSSDVYISFSYPKGEGVPEPESLSIRLTCTNGSLPGLLRVGDIRHSTASSPEGVTFANITPVAPAIMPPVGGDVLWRLVSHLSLNLMSLARAENLRELLALYIFEENGANAAAVAANRLKIDAIEKVVANPADRLLHGLPIRGTEIRISVRGDNFAGAGDLYLFGSILDHFFGCCAGLNTFTRLTIEDVVSGESWQWQPRLGQQTLL